MAADRSDSQADEALPRTDGAVTGPSRHPRASDPNPIRRQRLPKCDSASGTTFAQLFAGGLLPVLEYYRHRAADMLDHLDERVSILPLKRIADACVVRSALDPGVRVLLALLFDDPELWR